MKDNGVKFGTYGRILSQQNKFLFEMFHQCLVCANKTSDYTIGRFHVINFIIPSRKITKVLSDIDIVI